MRLSIDHQTGFRYATRVKSSYNDARMTPAETDHQTVWSSRITIEPAAWSFNYTDYWGTLATTFEVHEPHHRLSVHAQASSKPMAMILPGTSTGGSRPMILLGQRCRTVRWWTRWPNS